MIYVEEKTGLGNSEENYVSVGLKTALYKDLTSLTHLGDSAAETVLTAFIYSSCQSFRSISLSWPESTRMEIVQV